MQSVQRSTDINENQWRAQELRRRRWRFIGRSSTTLMALFIAGIYLFFVYNMQGFNFDTVALAIYCTGLTMFIVKCFTTGSSQPI
jgi:hypothetical protein